MAQDDYYSELSSDPGPESQMEDNKIGRDLPDYISTSLFGDKPLRSNDIEVTTISFLDMEEFILKY